MKLALNKVNKCYNEYQIKAIDDLSLEIDSEKITAVVGENGAGKSTLGKLLAGAIPLDSGHISKYRIAMIFQNSTVIPELTVMENLCMISKLGVREIKGAYVDTLEKLKLPFRRSLSTPASQLDYFETRLLEFLAVWMTSPDFIIFDETTTDFNNEQVAFLFDLFEKLKSNNCGVVFITHKLKEVEIICERAVVLKNGRLLAYFQDDEIQTDLLEETMFPDIAFSSENGGGSHGTKSVKRKAAIRMEELSVHTEAGNVHIKELLIEEHAINSIIGIRSEGLDAVELLFEGRALNIEGTVEIGGGKAEMLNGALLRKNGVSFIPHDRLLSSIVPSFSIFDNSLALEIQQLSKWGLTNNLLAGAHFEEVMNNLSIKFSKTQSAEFLSGGNMQKFLIARELATKKPVVVVIEPELNLDVNSLSELYRSFKKYTELGTIVLITTDLDRAIENSDSISVVNNRTLKRNFQNIPSNRKAIERAYIGLDREVL